MNIIEWIKSNKLSFTLFLIVGFLLFKSITSATPYYRQSQTFDTYTTGEVAMGVSGRLPSVTSFDSNSGTSYPAPMDESVSTGIDRKTVTENSVSLVVKEVVSAVENITSEVTRLGGFEVSSNVNRPEESTSATLTVRVPADKSEDFLNYVRGQAVKVVSLHKQGHDVTDQYRDIESRLKVLEESYSRIEQIYDSAIDVDEMLRVQTQLFSLRDQIDALKGQQKYLNDVSSTQKFTIYLSTDEFSLPYAPQGAWRPDVTFKYAVRSLVQNIRGLGNMLIWTVVYAALIVPIVLLILFVGKRMSSKKSTTTVSS